MKDLIQLRLEKYHAKSSEEELNALKEITQEVLLYSLHKAEFFTNVCFLGGTSLRIVHGLDRFSEDLDFSLWVPDDEFDLDPFIEKSSSFMNAYGYDMSIDSKALDDRAVQSRFLKDSSIKNVLAFKYAQDTRAKIKIKIEIDIRPPQGAGRIIRHVDFPLDFPVGVHDLPSLMSGKLHALLCRPYSKGRDWYDFLWYVSQGVSPNLVYLKNALFQTGPWQGEVLKMNESFVKTELLKKVRELVWKDIALDVRKFLSPAKIESLELWSEDFFAMKVKKMNFSETMNAPK